jgi:hypothetical protein
MRHLKNYQEYGSTFTHEDHEYDLNKMFKLVNGRKSEDFPISKLKWILKWTNIKSARVKKADKGVPILICKFGSRWIVYDGVHRLTKALEDGDKTIKVIKVPLYILKKSLIDPNKKGH